MYDNATTAAGDRAIIRLAPDTPATKQPGAWEFSIQNNRALSFYWNYYTSSSWLMGGTVPNTGFLI